MVTRSTTLAHLLYASPAWWGLMRAGEVERVERLVKRVQRAGFLPFDKATATHMVGVADDTLFAAVIRDADHVLRGLFTERRVIKYNLRPISLIHSN